ncbi:T9SS type A sorting domain-containing protein [Polaribacter sp. Z014]|uniref:DUF7619 domain-containing protein n=1 Tax=Polaribacter sp. Z014 TaxID=2927126 RepID=UPI0020205465|nr:T9SS type A sorting domain-containing protein [Polaribacter sp. Z014]MCL7763102.1 T9SS type A sorting domain-containing protein [Polaribacter sp. Z014]
MKLKLLSIVLLFFTNIILSQNITIPDYNFKEVLLNNSSINTDGNYEISVTEAEAVTILNISGYQEFIGGEMGEIGSPGISDFTGIEAFINLTSLTCSQNDLSSLDVSALTQLTYLDCSSNINPTGMATNSGISTLILPNNNILETLICKENYITSLDLSNKTALTHLDASSNYLASLNITNTPALENLNASYNYSLTSLDLSNHANLTSLNAENCTLNNLNINNTPQLETLKCKQNQLSVLNASSSAALKTLECYQNRIVSLDLTNNTNLITVSTSNNLLTNLQLPTTNTLTSLLCNTNKLPGLDTTMATSLITLKCNSNLLTNLLLPTTSTLSTIETTSNKLTTLNTTDVTGLITLKAHNNLLTNLTLPNSTSLQTLEVYNNQLATINLLPQAGLTNLNISNNSLPLLDVSGNLNLQTLRSSNNQLAVLNTLSNTSLNYLECSNNLITSLDTTTINTLASLSCSGNLLTELDLSSFSNLSKLYCNNNLLTSLNLKNGNSNTLAYNTFTAKNNTNLNAICIDDALVAAGNLGNGIDPHMNFTEYCSFVPVNSNTITGTVSFDFNNDGCDAADTKSVNTRINSTSANVSASAFSATDGTYTIYINDTNVNTELIPNFPSFFTATPTTQTTNFTGSGNTETIDFCITANSQVNDVEVYAFTTSESRPGFDTQLRVFYKNNGSTIIPSGTITLNFNENQEIFNNASTSPDAQTSNSLTWNYTNLMPFQESYIDVQFTINTPTNSTNPVNGGDTITYTTSITPLTGDATPADNTHIFSDIIVNAYDPNDVVCFEGDKISTTQVPNDLTYRVRFQNTGTASAINIVVKDIIDADLDMTTFQPVAASHSYRTAISNTNKVEFIFENIHLADSTSNEPASHGWLFYKIKPKSNTVIGDDFDTTANIYFDYNAPVITNTYNTAVAIETTIPDNNFEMALINAGLDKGIPDSKVFTDNVNMISNLDVSNKNISDLTGIEDFTSLTTLNVSDNQLTDLDVSAHTLLTSLNIQSNALTSLNVKNGNNTVFTLFNAINNPNLTCIEVDNATWSADNWTNIDTTSNFVNNQAECTALSTDTYNTLAFSLFPNPTNGKITITALEKADLLIYSLLGNEIKKRVLNSGKNEITDLNLSKGIYLFKLVTKEKSATKKVIVN